MLNNHEHLTGHSSLTTENKVPVLRNEVLYHGSILKKKKA
jgi:hypothetical protein